MTRATDNSPAEEQASTRRAERAEYRVQRLRQLVARYKHTKSVQYALLQLSELASTVTDMDTFYAAMHGVIGKLLHAENFYVVLVDSQTDRYTPVYFSDKEDFAVLEQLSSSVFSQGLTGYVYRTGKSLLCDLDDVKALAAKGEVVMHGAMSSHWMGIPLIRGRRPVGVMAVQSYDDTRYSQNETELLEFISLHLVTAMDRVKQRELLEQDVRNRTRELSQLNQNLQEEIKERERAETLQNALFKISQITATAAAMDDFYQAIHEVLKTLIYADNCYIALISKDGSELSFPFYADEKRPKSKTRKLGRGLTEYIIKKGEACLIDERKSRQLMAEGQIYRRVQDQGMYGDTSTSWLGAPLVISDKVIGVITTQAYETRSSIHP